MRRRHRFRRAALLAAALAMPIAAAPARAADRDAPFCLSRADMKAVAGFALPLLIEGASLTCRALLPPGAFLSRAGPGLAERYRREGGGWAGARDVIQRALGDKLPHGLSPQTQEMLVTDIVKGMVGDKLKPRDCATASRVTELLSPLPADNLSELAILLIDLGSRGKARDKAPPFTICPMPGAR